MLSRVLFALPTIIGVFIVVFFVVRLIPGDPASAMLGPKATTAQIEQYREHHGLNEPVYVQFGVAFKKFIKGDLGQSLSWYRPARDVIMERLPRSAELAFFGVLFGTIAALIFGVIAAVYRGRWPDLLLTSFATLGMSLPMFYIGLWILVIFAMKLKIIPVISTLGGGVSYWQSLLGPVLAQPL